MLNEEKLKLMTGIAMFEKAEGKRLALVKRYYKGDYISRNLLKAFLGYTLCWVIGLAMAAACSIEDILSIVSLGDIWQYAVGYGMWYVAGLVVYLVIVCITCFRRYSYAARGMKVYTAKLRRLEKRYEFQNRTKERGKEVRKS